MQNALKEPVSKVVNVEPVAPPVPHSFWDYVRSFGPGIADMLGFPVQQGLLIQTVRPNSAAAAAGLRGGNRMAIIGMRRVLIGGDILAEIDGQAINEDFDLTLILNRKRPGDVVTLRIYRGDQRMDVKATLRDQ